MNLMELITDPNGTLSHTKIWSNIANFVATIAFIYQIYTKELTAELLGVYVSVVGIQRAVSKFIDTKTYKKEDIGL